jgi:hypothetical protein
LGWAVVNAPEISVNRVAEGSVVKYGFKEL